MFEAIKDGLKICVIMEIVMWVIFIGVIGLGFLFQLIMGYNPFEFSWEKTVLLLLVFLVVVPIISILVCILVQ